MMRGILNKKNKVKLFYFTLSIVSLVIVGIVDYRTGYRISSMVFYLIPIFISTMFLGWSTGVGISVLCAIVWLIADLKGGGSRYVYFFTPYWNALARGFFFMTVVFAIELRTLLRREKKESGIDFLTKIGNRKYFYEFAVKEIDRCKRYKHPLTLVFLDCDNFKQVNDEFGHKAGDRLLRCVADAIKNHVRGSDVAARLGGDEFAVLLTETELEGALNFVKRVNISLNSAMQKNNWPVTASFGIAAYRVLPTSVDEMVKQADKLMYSAKKEGKNRIKHYLFDSETNRGL
jgi:diguanylate cyclase (GGDEF)-like protein